MFTVGTVIALALYALLDTIISLLINGAMFIAQQIMDSSITVFASDSNIISIFINLLPFSTREGVNVVGSIINGMSYGIITFCLIIGIVSSITAPLTGGKSENPANVVARVVFAIIMKNLLFGTGVLHYVASSFDGLLGVLGRWFGLILSFISIPKTEFININTLNPNPVAYLGILILMATVLTGVIGAAISYIERILSFAVSILFGPIAVSLYAYKDTADVAKNWIMSIFTQFGAIFLNLLMWSAFIIKMNSISSILPKGITDTTLIFDLAVAVAILALVKNSEKIFNSFGLRTMPNQDAARSIAGGLAALGTGAMMAMRATPAVKGAIERAMHGKNPVMGGRGGSVNGIGGASQTPYTGNANLYDSKGKMSVDGEGNAAKRAIAQVGNYGAKVGATSAAQNRQSNAMHAIHSLADTVKENNALEGNPNKSIAGTTLGSMKISDNDRNSKKIRENGGIDNTATTYTGAQIANMAISGHANTTGFNFAGNKHGDMVFGTSNTLNDNNVIGVVGQATYNNASNGRVSTTGTYFMPTQYEGGVNQIAIGTQVDIGDGKDWFITGDAINIDDSGHVAYEITTAELDFSDVNSSSAQKHTTNEYFTYNKIFNFNPDENTNENPNENTPDNQETSTTELGIDNKLNNDDY